MSHFRTKKKKFINSRISRVPQCDFLYSPYNRPPFSTQGEGMVYGLLEVATSFSDEFETYIPIEEQYHILEGCFDRLKEEHYKKISKRRGTEGIVYDAIQDYEDKLTGQPSKPFLLSGWHLLNMVPRRYFRTMTPRLSSKGITLHSMNEDLVKQVLIEASTHFPVTFLDIDMSACHARIAASLQNRDGKTRIKSTIDQPIKFWDKQTELLQPFLQNEGLLLKDADLSNILKMAFSYSLNGYDPEKEFLLLPTIKKHAPYLLDKYPTLNHFQASRHLGILKEMLLNFELIREVRDLNTFCESNAGKGLWTIDRRTPYKIPSTEMGISRVLQGFEVVLLSALTRFVLIRGGLPLNLAHDTLLVAFKNTPGFNARELCFTLSDELSEWSSYLLGGYSLPLEAKYTIQNGIYLDKTNILP